MSKLGILIPCVDSKTLREVFGNTDYASDSRNQYLVKGSYSFNLNGTIDLNYQTVLIKKPIEIDGNVIELPKIVSRRYSIKNIEPESILEQYLEENDIHQDSAYEL